MTISQSKMENAVTHFTNLAKTIADVGNAEDGLCRIEESGVAKSLALFSHLWIGNLYKRHSSDWQRFQSFLRREHGNLLSDSELSKVQP